MISWRDVLKVHPAADLFPLMSREELLELGEDIKKRGLQSPIALGCRKTDSSAVRTCFLLDGRNRLDAMEFVGLEVVHNGEFNYGVVSSNILDDGIDPYEFVISANIHRRHLTAEQKRDLIAKLLKANPEKSNRQVAKLTGVSHPHVAKVRTELEQTGDVETVSTSIDTKGRKQPAKRRRTENDFVKDIAARQAAVTGTEAQPSNPITAAWDEASDAQRLEFAKDRAEHLERVVGAGSRVRSKKRARPGMRLPEDWTLSDADAAAARALLPESRIPIEFDKFRDHWRASASPNAVKRDWSAAWRNWCRKAVEIAGERIDRGPTRRGNSMAEIARGGT